MTFKSKLPLSSYTFALALSAVFAGAPFAAHAGDFLSDLDSAAAPILAKDGTITHYGVTLYGAYDINGNYQSHGAGNSASLPQTTAYEILPVGDKANWLVSGNGMSQTSLGLKGNIPTVADVNVVFNLNAGINPLNGTLADGAKSLIKNSKATAYAGVNGGNTSPNSGSSRSGQLFNGAAFGGLSHPVAGQITYGRHTTVMTDVIGANDPFAGSYAFSMVGFSSTAVGAGAGEEARYDRSLRYSNKYGPVRFAAMYQFEGANLRNGGDAGYQFDLGVDYGPATLDLVYVNKNGAVKTSQLTANNTAYAAENNGLDPYKTIGGTVVDSTAYGIFGTYKPITGLKTFGGYEVIYMSNAHNASSITNSDLNNLGKYNVILASATALTTYDHTAVLQYMWAGANYDLTKDLKLLVGYYHTTQNSFLRDPSSVNPNDGSTVKNTAGQMNLVSVGADYMLTKRLDLYTGVSWSQVGGGLDYTRASNSGTAQTTYYLHNNQLLALGGLRFRF